MPNLKASIKDVRKTKTRTKRNIATRRKCKKQIKALNKEIKSGNVKKTNATLNRTYKVLDKAAKKKLLKPKTVARKKSRLTKKLNKVISNAAQNVKNTKKPS